MKIFKQIFFNRISCSSLIIVCFAVILFTIKNVDKSSAQEEPNGVMTIANISGVNLSGEVTLSSDTTLTSNINVPANQTLTLDLNGYIYSHI